MGGDQLLLIDVVNAQRVLILQTIWAPADNVRYGRRLTRTETITDRAQLERRLAELVPLIFSEPSAAVRKEEGNAAVAADPAPAHAAGDLPVAA